MIPFKTKLIKSDGSEQTIKLDSKGNIIKEKPFLPDVVEKKPTEKIIKVDRKSTRLNSSHLKLSRMPSSA